MNLTLGNHVHVCAHLHLVWKVIRNPNFPSYAATISFMNRLACYYLFLTEERLTKV